MLHSSPRVAVCQGKFPDFLLEEWDNYDFRKKSDNDRPSELCTSSRSGYGYTNKPMEAIDLPHGPDNWPLGFRNGQKHLPPPPSLYLYVILRCHR